MTSRATTTEVKQSKEIKVLRKQKSASKKSEVVAEAKSKASEKRVKQHEVSEEVMQEAFVFSRHIVDAVREPLLVIDGELKVLSANKSFYKTFQVNPDETIGFHIHELGNGQWDIPELRKILKDVITKTDTLDDFEISHRFETIGQRTMILNARRIPPTPEKPRMILLAIEDVTEKQRTKKEYDTALEDKVKERTEQLARAKANDDAMLASIGDGLVATDREGKITLVNKAFENMLGLKGGDVVGKLLTEAVPMLDDKGDAVPERERPITIILKDHTRAITTSKSYKHKDGTVFPVIITFSPVFAGGEFVGVVEVFRDITDERAVDRAKTEFVSLASHQLRTPLTAVSWYAEMLLGGNVGSLDERQKKYLAAIYTGNQRMVELVNALMDVSRLELGTFLIEPEPTDIVTLAQSEIDGQKPLIGAKHIRLEFTYEKDTPRIQADPKLLRMVFQNLLSNAVKYTPEGGSIEIAISLVPGNARGEMLIRVSDTGYGIPKNQQDKIFTKLFRADNVRQKDTGGTGLGLYIVKSIVENSGGTIRFESEENKGTTFFVTLPRDGGSKK